MDLLLRFVDFLLRLRSPEPPAIPHPALEPCAQTLPHLSFELGNEMRALRWSSPRSAGSLTPGPTTGRARWPGPSAAADRHDGRLP